MKQASSLFVVLALLACSGVHCLIFPLTAARPRCFKDYLAAEKVSLTLITQVVIGHYVVNNQKELGQDYTLNLIVYSPDGKIEQGMPKTLPNFAGQFHHLAHIGRRWG